MSGSFLTSSRRKFVQYGTMLGVGAQALLKSGDLRASVFEGKEAAGLGDPWPQMQYRTLGRTGHKSSRLVFGCGATLSRERHDDLLDAAYDAGVKTFDVGFKHYYNDAEKNLAPFLKKRRDNIFLISKAYVPVDIDWDETITVAQAKQAAKGWAYSLDESLAEMGIDHVDAYYYMASNNVSVTSPARTAPWIAAPSATASSGLTSLRGSLPKKSATAFCTIGMRVCPPTRMRLMFCRPPPQPAGFLWP